MNASRLGATSAMLDKSKMESQMKHMSPDKRERRVKPKKVYIQNDNDSDGQDEFTANPAEDLPRNKLIEKIARGL